MNKASIPPALVAGAVLLVAGGASPQSTDLPGWKGTREVRDGVVYVSNDGEPVEGEVEYDLRESWRIASEAAGDSLLFGVVGDVVEDRQGNVLVLDSQLHRVLVIGPTGEILRTLGREGDGPGELRAPTSLCAQVDGSIAVLEPQAHRCVRIGPEGDPLPQWNAVLDGTPGARIVAATPVRESYAVQLMTYFAQNDEVRRTCVVQLFSADGTASRELLRQYRALPRTRPARYVEETGADLLLCDADDSGRVLIAPTWRDYALSIYDAESGALEMVVTRDQEALARTPEEIEEEREYAVAYYGGKDRVEAVISPVHRTIAAAVLNTDGTIWVSSSRGWKLVGNGIAARYDVFDVEGRYLREAVLRGDVSPDDDVTYLLEGRLVNVEAGHTAASQSLGLAGESAAEEDAGQTSIVCYQLVRRL